MRTMLSVNLRAFFFRSMLSDDSTTAEIIYGISQTTGLLKNYSNDDVFRGDVSALIS